MHMVQGITSFYEAVAVDHCPVGDVPASSLVESLESDKRRLQEEVLYWRGLIDIEHAAKSDELAHAHENMNELVRKHENLRKHYERAVLVAKALKAKLVKAEKDLNGNQDTMHKLRSILEK